MRFSHLVAGGACALLVSFPAWAQEKAQSKKEDKGTAAAGSSSAARGAMPLQQNQTRQQLFDKLDSNKSGSVSRAEAEATPALVVIFVEMDANGDGELSAAEFGRVPLASPAGTPAK